MERGVEVSMLIPTDRDECRTSKWRFIQMGFGGVVGTQHRFPTVSAKRPEKPSSIAPALLSMLSFPTTGWSARLSLHNLSTFQRSQRIQIQSPLGRSRQATIVYFHKL